MITVIVFTMPSAAQVPDPALASFQTIVNRFEKFFSQPRKMIESQPLSSSPNGASVAVREFQAKREFAFDVEKTNSLVSPFVGTITTAFVIRSNDQCGDIPSRNPRYPNDGFTDSAKALASDKAECYKHDSTSLIKPMTEEVELTFAYQNGKWVFKKATRTKVGDHIINDPQIQLEGIFDAPHPYSNTHFENKDAEAMNQPWRELLK